MQKGAGMKVYQPRKNNNYWLPHNLYMRTIYFVKDYQRMREKYRELSTNILQVRNFDPTGDTAEQCQRLSMCIKAIENAQEDIPQEYRRYILENICSGKRFPDIAARATWSRHKQRFINKTAQNMEWL